MGDTEIFRILPFCSMSLSATLVTTFSRRQSMIKPNIPPVSGIGALTDTLDFVKNLWGSVGVPGMKIPGMVMPSLSVEEINKQISDLKAVESWLTLNMNMLRGTIQGLEVQSATIAALQSLGQTLNAGAASVKPDKPATPASPVSPQPTVAAQREDEEKTAAVNSTAMLGNPAAWWNVLQDQFTQAVNTAVASEVPSATIKAEPAANPRKRTSKSKFSSG
jgi:hypothetical protein